MGKINIVFKCCGVKFENNFQEILSTILKSCFANVNFIVANALNL